MPRQQIPNTLTMARLVLAGAFFVVLNQFRYVPGQTRDDWLVLGSALLLFILAAVTDALDGYLARIWKVESTFGRIMDPFCDKVLILGALIYLAGARFVDPDAIRRGDFFTMASGVYPWMVVVILARELLVTGIRAQMEGMGIKFGANWFGKLKMILQSIVVPVILVILWLDPARDGWQWLTWVRDVLVYATVITTVWSGLPYVTRSITATRKKKLEAGS